jgi:hypothetical protein
MIKQGLVHTVFFWLKNPTSAEDQAALKTGLDQLACIDLIQEAYIGKPAGSDRGVVDSSYDYSITFVFATAEDQEAYQPHPLHEQFIATCGHLWARVQVYDAI